MMNRDKIAMKLMTKSASWVGVLLVMVSVSGCQNIPQSRVSDSPKAVTAVLDGDDDHDGVPNSIDQCPNTPKDTVVDSRGCTVPTICLDCDLPNYTARLYFNHNETYPSDNVMYDYGTPIGKKYVDNKGKMDGIIKNLANIKANNPEFFKEVCIHLEGHNSKGKYGENNPKLSEQRVLTVKQIFIENYGVDKNLIKTVFYGSDRPIAPNNEKYYSHNQRVFMDIKPCR